MAHELPKLPYAYDALEPHIDAKTMEIHHSKHHQTYVNNLNNILEGHGDLIDQPLERLLANIMDVPESIRTAIRNNGGGVANHSLYWDVMGPGKGGEPTGDLMNAITSELGGFDKFKESFSKAGLTRFGSGWAWLTVGSDRKLCVCSSPNQDSPLMKGISDCPGTPILCMDVWEHAYYLNYQNRRPDYIKAWWNVVNWDKVAELYAAAKG